MNSAIKVVKRKDRETRAPSPAVDASSGEGRGIPDIVQTVKSWIVEARDRRQAEAQRVLRSFRELDVSHGLEPAKEAVKPCLTILFLAGLIVSGLCGSARAQSPAPLTESLTLERAIDLAVRNNRVLKIAQLGVERADENVSVAKTYRFPEFRAFAHVSGNLARNELQIANPAVNFFPGVGSFFSLSVIRRPTGIFGAAVTEPLSQQYRIGLEIKEERLAREAAQAKLRAQRNETVDQVKKAYYAILQTKSAVGSVREAVKSYQQLEQVTGAYVVQQVVLRSDYLGVQTRLAQARYEEMELSDQLSTQKEQLNRLLGREVTAEFEPADVSCVVSVDPDLETARRTALEHRPELQGARIAVQQATIDRRIKKSEYIPDVSLGFVYLTARNFAAVVPKNFANVGISATWEVFDWGRKRHQLAEKDQAIGQANLALKEAEAQVLIEVGAKFRKLQLTGQALRVAMLAQETAKETLRVNTGRYGYQTVLLSDVLQSQATLAEATHQFEKALLAFWTAKAEFETALGEEG
jgi:outer membrane protein TolC